MNEKIPYKIYLSEDEIPYYWYNVRADMKNKPAPLLNSQTLQPMTHKELSEVFCEELAAQELNESDAYIEIPKEIRDFYKMYRWCEHTAWKKNWARPPRSIINLRVTTQAAAIS